jgi:hypothetical protein
MHADGRTPVLEMARMQRPPSPVDAQCVALLNISTLSYTIPAWDRAHFWSDRPRRSLQGFCRCAVISSKPFQTVHGDRGC